MGSIDKACISGFLCRLCSEMHRIVIHIYGDQGQRLCLVEKINGYLPITISPTDPLPKTICTTCLRRVEQHYDLLMRLSRIKEERFLRYNKEQRRHEADLISSIENSDDEVYHSDEEHNRPQQQLQSSQSQQQQVLSTSAETPSSATIVAPTTATNSRSLNAVDPDSDADDDESAASTSAGALTALTQNLISIVSSATAHRRSLETDTSYGDNAVGGGGGGNAFVLQQNND